ncbi:MAG TPA: hypothetical protein PKJ24_02395 [Prolixibacteraceae bacterium]|nr:hypothetical protein [Prolixibacteraceae bacterium]HPT30936.1 hypothetical protein [Prolixibacteraceae bacterium]
MKTPEILKLLKNSALLSEGTLPQTAQLVSDYPWFAAGWALYARNLEITGNSGSADILNKVALMAPDRKWLRNLMKGSSLSEKQVRLPEEYQIPELTGEESTRLSASGKSRLIEDFLESGARFNTFAEDESSSHPVDLSEKAAALTDEIVTENFANILVRQKKFTEAIEAFQKLSLKYPEKSIYFAARIEEIKNIERK